MVAISQRDVIVVVSSNTDGSPNPRRTAYFIVLSPTEYNKNSMSILACPLTTSANRFNIRAGIPIRTEHLEDEGYLDDSSIARFDTIATLRNDRVKKVIGRVRIQWYQELLNKIREFIRIQA